LHTLRTRLLLLLLEHLLLLPSLLGLKLLLCLMVLLGTAHPNVNSWVCLHSL
jgi:hypothetical protein